ncbi:MAG: hypothetical protein WBK45_04755 [Tepidanaerobacteraceae bacterium]
MKVKNGFYTTVFIVCIILIACSSNSSLEQVGLPAEEKEANSEISSDSSPWSINAYLKELPNVILQKWSPDNKKVAYTVFEQSRENTRIYIWHVGEKEPKLVQGVEGKIDDLYWSPDSRYIVADIGTSALRLGEIVDVERRIKVDSIKYAGKPAWAPDSKWLALGKVRSIIPPIEWELEGTIDLIIYNIETKETKVIKEGNQNEYYKPLTWGIDGVLDYACNKMSGDSYIRCYLPEEGNMEDEFEKRVKQKYFSPSKKNEVIIVSNNGGYNAYCKTENYFSRIKEFSFLRNLPTVSWSPQEKYLILVLEGLQIFSGYVYDVHNGHEMGEIDYLKGPFWSPTGDYFAFTRRGENIPEANNSGRHYTTDLCIFDLELGNYFIELFKGTADFYYTAEGWEKEGIAYSQRDYASGKVLEKGKYVYARHIVSWNPETGEEKVLESFSGRKYGILNYSPDNKWISLIKYHPSAGDAFPGNPAFYNTLTGEIKELDIVFQATGGWEEISWFHKSPRVIIEHSKLLDINTWTKNELKVPENERILGSKPAPDDKIAVFTYKPKEDNHDNLGIPLKLYIMSDNGQKILNENQTEILPYFHNNTQCLLPVNCDWLDSNTLVLESWREQYKEIADVYKIDVNTGETYKLIENAYNPCPAPDGSKIAVTMFNDGSSYFSQDIKVVDTDGDIIKTLNCKDFDLDFFGSDMIWSTDSSKLVVKGYKKENKVRKQYVVIYDFIEENSKTMGFKNNQLSHVEKNLLFVSEDGREIIYSQLGRLEESYVF